MTLDPQNIFLGLMHFSSILLPGALLIWLLRDEVGPVVGGIVMPSSLEAAKH